MWTMWEEISKLKLFLSLTLGYVNQTKIRFNFLNNYICSECVLSFAIYFELNQWTAYTVYLFEKWFVQIIEYKLMDTCENHQMHWRSYRISNKSLMRMNVFQMNYKNRRKMTQSVSQSWRCLFVKFNGNWNASS